MTETEYFACFGDKKCENTLNQRTADTNNDSNNNNNNDNNDTNKCE